MDVLARIKRLVRFGRIRYPRKARDEMALDVLSENEVVESLVNAASIAKTLRSRSPQRRSIGEKLYVIKSCTGNGTLVYTKGAVRRQAGVEIFYILISAKIATLGD